MGTIASAGNHEITKNKKRFPRCNKISIYSIPVSTSTTCFLSMGSLSTTLSAPRYIKSIVAIQGTGDWCGAISKVRAGDVFILIR